MACIFNVFSVPVSLFRSAQAKQGKEWSTRPEITKNRVCGRVLFFRHHKAIITIEKEWYNPMSSYVCPHLKP